MVIQPRPACSPFGQHPGFGASGGQNVGASSVVNNLLEPHPIEVTNPLMTNNACSDLESAALRQKAPAWPKPQRMRSILDKL